MAESYKRLGAIAPSDDGYKLLYTSPSATDALVSNITVTNRSASAQTFDINVYESGVTQQSDLDDATVSGNLVAVAKGSSAAAVSTDGTTWTASTLPSSEDWSSVIYGSGTFAVLAGKSGYYSFYYAAVSTDGITWSTNGLGTSGDWTSITYGDGKFVAVGKGYGANNVSSTDAITWSVGNMPSYSDWCSVTYGNDIFVAISGRPYNPSSAAAVSTDGTTWTASTLPASNDWSSMTYGNGIFVAVSTGFYGSIGISTNGVSWSSVSQPQNFLSSITYGGGKFVAVSTNYYSTSVYSTDGTSWNSANLPSSQNWSSVSYANGTFVAVAGGSYGSDTVAYSTDGTTWTASTLPSSSNWSSVSSSEVVQPYTPPSQTTLYKTSDIAANSTEVLEPGIALGPEGAIVVKDNSGGNLTFSTYGVELS